MGSPWITIIDWWRVAQKLQEPPTAAGNDCGQSRVKTQRLLRPSSTRTSISRFFEGETKPKSFDGNFRWAEILRNNFLTAARWLVKPLPLMHWKNWSMLKSCSMSRRIHKINFLSHSKMFGYFLSPVTVEAALMEWNCAAIGIIESTISAQQLGK